LIGYLHYFFLRYWFSGTLVEPYEFGGGLGILYWLHLTFLLLSTFASFNLSSALIHLVSTMNWQNAWFFVDLWNTSTPPWVLTEIPIHVYIINWLYIHVTCKKSQIQKYIKVKFPPQWSLRFFSVLLIEWVYAYIV
jgi:hypothetical protein